MAERRSSSSRPYRDSSHRRRDDRPYRKDSRSRSPRREVVLDLDQTLDAPAFAALGLPRPLTCALANFEITEPFPIQAATIGDAIAGLDVLGRGKTGSGKLRIDPRIEK